MTPKYYLIPVGILLLCILIFGFTRSSAHTSKEIVPWSERALTWDDFELVESMEEDYVASIYSIISCPDLITDSNSRVYAFMNPNLSERLEDEYDSYNVLVHEQYHFNITEYCARLLRKEIVDRGLGGLSFQTLDSLKKEYGRKLDSLQNAYDSITDHNVNIHLQRYWELQIDDWLRQTASYQNEDIYSYYNFTKNRTRFFKEIYFTQTQKVLPSFPVGETEKELGKVYEIIYPKHGQNEMVVKFYQDGKLSNGGYFETAVTKITKSDKSIIQVHYYDSGKTYNTEKTACVRKIIVDKDENRTERFFNASGERVYKDSVYEIGWAYNPHEKSYYTTYYDGEGQKIANQDGIYHQKSLLDEKERTVVLQNLDHRNRPKNDNSYIARYETSFTGDNMALYKRLYDETGNFALHLSDYHLDYTYDDWGRAVQITSLDARGEETYDHNGASIYEYTYDLHDRQTSVKRFNTSHEPIVANDDYFKKVKDYDAQGRIIFEAEYLPENVLRFSNKKDGALKYVYPNDSIKKIYNVDAYNTVFENDMKVAVSIQILNSENRVVRETYLDADENYAKTDNQVVSYRYQYDPAGNQTEATAYDSVGRPREFEPNVATIRWEYDTKGNKLQTAYFDKNYELAKPKDGITYNVYSYNERNELVSRSNFNHQLKPAEVDGTFQFLVHTAMSGQDSLTLEYDSDKRLRAGVAITRYSYSRYGKVAMVEYFDRNHQRTKNPDGISAVRYLYNQRHMLTGYEYLDEKNMPVNNKDGVAFEYQTLDALGHTLDYSYYDKAKNPVIGEEGYHKIEYKWDAIGQIIESAIYGTGLEPIHDELGTATYKYTLHKSGMIQTIERYDAGGLLADNTDSVAITHYEPRLNGLYFLERELNTSGEIVTDSSEGE